MKLAQKMGDPKRAHTPSGKPDGVAIHYTCPTPEAVHWASPRGMPRSALVREGCTCHLVKRKGRKGSWLVCLSTTTGTQTVMKEFS